MSVLLPFLKPRPRLRLEGRAVYLRPPRPGDHRAWAWELARQVPSVPRALGADLA
ncbi:hypothetical protein ACRAWD_12700 [Caulobacter segnis]